VCRGCSRRSSAMRSWTVWSSDPECKAGLPYSTSRSRWPDRMMSLSASRRNECSTAGLPLDRMTVWQESSSPNWSTYQTIVRIRFSRVLVLWSLTHGEPPSASLPSPPQSAQSTGDGNFSPSQSDSPETPTSPPAPHCTTSASASSCDMPSATYL
jgi:hypothetical protein